MSSLPSEPPEPSAHGEPVDPAGPVDYTPPESAVKFTKMAAAWWALIVGLVVLAILLVFIGQNTDRTTIHFLGWDWNTYVAVAIIVSAMCGSGITVLISVARMAQLHRAARKNLHSSRT